jgi:hypothetical protein
MISTDPYRFLNIVRCTRLRASRAVRLTYDSGLTEVVSADYLVATAIRINHPEAAELRARLGSRPTLPASNRTSGAR